MALPAKDDIAKDIKIHEDSLEFWKSQYDHLDKSILDLKVNLGKYYSVSTQIAEDLKKDASEKTEQKIKKQERTAASLFYQVKTLLPDKVSKDVLGIVATLTSVDNDNLSRRFSEYLGLEKMLAIVCRTIEGVEALEKYDKEGKIDSTYALHGLGASVQTEISGRFLVICLEDLRPYTGGFIDGDQHKKLALPKPELPNGSSPVGFLGFAVNMINIDTWNLTYVTTDGHGLRETLFYALFSRLQVYRTRNDMLQALPCITNGALSLDGGMIKKKSAVFALGDTNDMEVKFPVVINECYVVDDYSRTEDKIRKLEWDRLKVARYIQREQTLLDRKKGFRV